MNCHECGLTDFWHEGNCKTGMLIADLKFQISVLKRALLEYANPENWSDIFDENGKFVGECFLRDVPTVRDIARTALRCVNGDDKNEK